MTEREFYMGLRRHLLGICALIEQRYAAEAPALPGNGAGASASAYPPLPAGASVTRVTAVVAVGACTTAGRVAAE